MMPGALLMLGAACLWVGLLPALPVLYIGLYLLCKPFTIDMRLFFVYISTVKI
jgi:hypothetical protein